MTIRLNVNIDHIATIRQARLYLGAQHHRSGCSGDLAGERNHDSPAWRPAPHPG
jgi:hypothetical protein